MTYFRAQNLNFTFSKVNDIIHAKLKKKDMYIGEKESEICEKLQMKA